VDKTKLSQYELENYDKICEIESDMSSEEDLNFIHDFFIKMWEKYDYKTEKRPVIIFSTPSFTGTDWFRLRVPLYNLWKKHADKYYIILTTAFNLNMMKHADLIISHRAGDMHLYSHKIESMWPSFIKKPIIIHEVDDNEFNLPDSHPLKSMWLQAGKDQMSKKQIANAHYVTTTGRVLKREFSRLNQFNKIEIIPNAFQWSHKQWDILDWEEKELRKPERARNRIVVGWAGLTSHFPDLVKMLKCLKGIQSKTKEKNPYFILSGMPTEDRMTMTGPDGKPMQIETPKEHRYSYRILNGFQMSEKERFEGYIPALGSENIEGQDVKSLWNYGEFYDQYDINLAYLAEFSVFNKSKSAIKVIEGFRKGAISVWTEWGGYQEFLENLPSDLNVIASKYMSAKSDEQFIDNVVYWINADESYRREIVEKFRKYVTETFDIEQINKKRIDIYDKILFKNKNGDGSKDENN